MCRATRENQGDDDAHRRVGAKPADEVDRYDVTADQYFIVGKKPPYDAGRMGTFLTKEPSKRARIVIDRINLKRNQGLTGPTKSVKHIPA